MSKRKQAPAPFEVTPGTNIEEVVSTIAHQRATAKTAKAAPTSFEVVFHIDDLRLIRKAGSPRPAVKP